MSKVVSISDKVYPVQDVIDDLVEASDSIKELVIVGILKDGTAYVSHTGPTLADLALACKLMDKEFSNLVDINEEGEED